MRKSYRSFLTGVMDPVLGKCMYTYLPFKIYLLCSQRGFMVHRINGDYFANNLICVMGIQGVYRFLLHCLGCNLCLKWSAMGKWNTTVVWRPIFEAKCHGENNNNNNNNNNNRPRRHYHKTTSTTVTVTSSFSRFLSPVFLRRVSWYLRPHLGMA